MKALAEIKNKRILVDTNILIYCGRDEFGQKFKGILRTLTDNKNALAVSNISGFEVIKKFKNEEKVIKYYTKLLDFITNINLDKRILINAGVLANKLYGKKNENEKSRKDNDFIIGATVVTHEGSLLMTCNRKDFSLPYWRIVARECVFWEDCEIGKIENVFLLEFDFDEWIKKMGVNTFLTIKY